MDSPYSGLNSQERKLSRLEDNLATYNKNLQEMEAAKAELEQIKRQYISEFRASSSHFNNLVAMDSLGLMGVENIQSAVSTAYSGTREKSLVSGIDNTLTGLKNKISSEEDKIKTCKQSIDATRIVIRGLTGTV